MCEEQLNRSFWLYTTVPASTTIAVVPGHQLDRSTINYEVPGSETTKIMGVFLALGSIAFAFGDTILPEIQVSQYCTKEHTQSFAT